MGGFLINVFRVASDPLSRPPIHGIHSSSVAAVNFLHLKTLVEASTTFSVLTSFCLMSVTIVDCMLFATNAPVSTPFSCLDVISCFDFAEIAYFCFISHLLLGL